LALLTEPRVLTAAAHPDASRERYTVRGSNSDARQQRGCASYGINPGAPPFTDR
jgi:hypothetical protein